MSGGLKSAAPEERKRPRLRNSPEGASGTLPLRRHCSANLLYKRTLVPAASRRANIVCSLVPNNSCFVLRTRSGPGEKTARSASQAGHDPSERCAKQEIWWRRFGIHQQTRKRRNLFHSPETELEKLFRNTRFLDHAILFSDLPWRTDRPRGFVTANTCKFQGCLRKSDRPWCS